MTIMVCPRCGKPQDQADECLYCGVVIAKYQQLQALPGNEPQHAAPPRPSTPPVHSNIGVSTDAKAALLRFGLVGAAIILTIWWVVPSPRWMVERQQRAAQGAMGGYEAAIERERQAYEEAVGPVTPEPRRVATVEPKPPELPPEPPTPLPETGPLIPCAEGPAPLTIDTRKRQVMGLPEFHLPGEQTVSPHHFLVKIVGPTTCVAFIRSGASWSASVPEGTYALRYAAGTTWKDEFAYFGDETTFHQADKPLELKRSHQLTVTLVLQRDGNLPTSGIGRSSF